VQPVGSKFSFYLAMHLVCALNVIIFYECKKMDVQAHRLLAVQISTRPVSFILSHPLLLHSSQPLSATRPRFFGGFAQN
jgi:hypothetical protein